MPHATTRPSAALADAVTSLHTQLDERLPQALSGDVEAVHRARVASRRLREVLAIAEAAVPGDHTRRVRREVRRVTDALGPVRELDVAMAELDRAAAAHGWRVDRTATVARALDRERARRRARMQHQLDRVDARWLRRRVSEVVEAVAAAPSDRDWRQALGARVTTRLRALQEALADCGTLYVPARLHAVRLAAKKLRYALEAAQDASGVDTTAPVATLRALQQEFGHWHDLQILHVNVEAVASEERPGRQGLAFARMAAVLEADCRQLHARLLEQMAAVPSVLTAIRASVLPRFATTLKMARVSTVGRSGVPAATRVRRVTA